MSSRWRRGHRGIHTVRTAVSDAPTGLHLRSCRAQPVLQHLVRREGVELQVPLRRGHQRCGWHEPHDLALEHAYSVARRLARDELEYPRDRRLLEICQVHRDLYDAAIFERNPHGLHEAQPAAAEPDRRGNLPGDFEPVGCEVDVVRNERHAGPDGRGAAAGVRGGGPEIWAPLWLLHLDRETFE